MEHDETPCTIQGTHCENCGSTDWEDVEGGEGYSHCCNEVVVNQDCCRGHHNLP